jgi:hypothetical protein
VSPAGSQEFLWGGVVSARAPEPINTSDVGRVRSNKHGDELRERRERREGALYVEAMH